MKKLSFSLKRNATKQQNILVRANNKILSWNIKKLVIIFVLLGTILGTVSAYFGYTNIYMNRERRFWAAIENSMATRSVTRTVETGGSGNLAVQKQRFFFKAEPVVASQVTYVQKSSTVDTEVVTAGLTYIDAQYSKYESFRTDQKADDGTVPTLDSLLGKWEESITPEEQKEDARLNYVSDMVSLAIIGNFSGDKRSQYLSTLRNENVYDINFDIPVEEKDENEETVLVYQASVSLKKFVTLLQDSFITAGYGDFPPLSTDNYREDAKIPATFKVLKKNNTLIGVSFSTRNEIYSNYGVSTAPERPQAVFKQGELETQVQELLKGAF